MPWGKCQGIVYSQKQQYVFAFELAQRIGFAIVTSQMKITSIVGAGNVDTIKNWRAAFACG